MGPGGANRAFSLSTRFRWLLRIWEDGQASSMEQTCDKNRQMSLRQPLLFERGLLPHHPLV